MRPATRVPWAAPSDTGQAAAPCEATVLLLTRLLAGGGYVPARNALPGWGCAEPCGCVLSYREALLVV